MTNVSRTYVHTSHTKEYLSTYVLERPVEYCQWIIEHFFIHVNTAKRKRLNRKSYKILLDFWQTTWLVAILVSLTRVNWGDFEFLLDQRNTGTMGSKIFRSKIEFFPMILRSFRYKDKEVKKLSYRFVCNFWIRLHNGFDCIVHCSRERIISA